MKFGFYGGVANNTYVLAKAFYNNAVPVIYIRDIFDNFPFSQPLWEDSEFILDYEFITDSSKWCFDFWEKKEKELGWLPPSFMVSQLENHATKFTKFNIKGNILEKLIQSFRFFRHKRRQAVINLMQENADLWIVCGIEATISAYASGKPYIIWPHGEDIRFVSGKKRFWENSFFHKKTYSNELNRYLLKQAYNNALFIGTHDSLGLGGHLFKIKYKFEYFPLTMPIRNKESNKKIRENNLTELFSMFGITLPKNKIYIFVPSRIDYYWKGTNHLIDAIKAVKPTNLHFIFSGWGKDYLVAQRELLKYNFTFLPFCMSKPLLFKTYECVDIVIDQFLFGTYGSSALEAMSTKTPVMMYININAFNEKGWLPPPVINVKTTDDISNALRKIDKGEFSLNEYTSKLEEWFRKTHYETVSVPMITSKIKRKLQNVF